MLLFFPTFVLCFSFYPPPPPYEKVKTKGKNGLKRGMGLILSKKKKKGFFFFFFCSKLIPSPFLTHFYPSFLLFKHFFVACNECFFHTPNTRPIKLKPGRHSYHFHEDFFVEDSPTPPFFTPFTRMVYSHCTQ